MINIYIGLMLAISALYGVAILVTLQFIFGIPTPVLFFIVVSLLIYAACART